MLDGEVRPDYADVAAALIRQIPKRSQGGAAVCVYHRGTKVVDIWGGTRDVEGDPWRAETTAASFSTTKGVVSTLVHILVEQGLAAYDDPIARYWPAFGAHGKEGITIRQALCHQAGLYRLSDMITRPDEMLDWEHMKQRVAEARPAHQPGAHHAYHALTYGWLVGGLIEAVSGRPLQRVLAEELTDPLGLDGVFIGMPHNQLYRRAMLIQSTMPHWEPRHEWQRKLYGVAESVLAWCGVRLEDMRATTIDLSDFDWNAQATVEAMIPAANGQLTARSLARMYAMIAGGGELDGVRLLSEERVRQITAQKSNQRDRALLGLPMRWRMGYHRAFGVGRRGHDAFGHYGYGGSGAFCDPSRDLAVAMTVNSGAGTPMGDTRMPRIARTTVKAVDRLDP